MKLKKKQKHDEDLNFWQPTSDLMSALMYILMLVIVLLGLYLVQIPEHSEIDPYLGDTYDDGGGVSPTPTPTYTHWGGGGGGDGGDGGGYTPFLTPTPTPTPTVTPTVSPTPDWPGSGGGWGGGTGGGNGEGDGPGDEPDVGMKSAVYVMMVDAETLRTIKVAGIEFELYTTDGALQILNTYYPERIAFRSYMTTENGTFYLPEKLHANVYELHQLTELEGYDTSANTEFVLDRTFDWPDPLVVQVPLQPSRNIIRVQMTDAETGQTIPGGSFDIIAAENILTADGTLRYRAGQTVGVIECDESGYGESEEIYLGQYTLRQRDIPQYYASYQEDIEVEVAKKSSVLPAINTVASERTRIQVMVADELYPNRGIEGVVLNVRSAGGEPFTVTTDYSGRITLEELKKSTVYRIAQTVTAEDYQPDRVEHTVTITADGRISGEAETEVNLTNRLIRVMIGVTDEFSNVQIPGKSLALYNSAGELIRTWTTTGNAQSFTDLQPGAYSVVIDGDTEQQHSVNVRDQAEVQEINLHSTYMMQYIVFGAIGLIILVMFIVVMSVLRRRKKRRRANE